MSWRGKFVKKTFLYIKNIHIIFNLKDRKLVFGRLSLSFVFGNFTLQLAILDLIFKMLFVLFQHSWNQCTVTSSLPDIHTCTGQSGILHLRKNLKMVNYCYIFETILVSFFKNYYFHFSTSTS